MLLGCLLGIFSGVHACVPQFDPEIACGDGFVDKQAGEECDPRNEESFIDACMGTSRPDGIARCDETTCTLIRDREQCATCGDEEIDGDEECDGANLRGQRCPAGDDAVQCDSMCKLDFSLCETCGDGLVDPAQGEECDKANVGGLLVQRPCGGANLGEPGEIPPLKPPNSNVPYTFGDAISCTDDCQLSRLGCSYCNNGRRDPPTPLDHLGNETLEETCDGDEFDLGEMLVQFPNSSCWDTPQIRPNVGCANDCGGYVTRPGEPACCVQSGADCPQDGPLRCCYEYAHPDSEPCELFINVKDQVTEVCR